MAERRMFAKSIIDSDAFLELPAKCQLLYFHLCMRADDDGFVNKTRLILRIVGARECDFRRLVDEEYLIAFPSGVVAIRHWKVHNYIPRDRYRETVHKEERALLQVDESNVYTRTNTTCIQPVHSLDTQDRLGKDRSGKDRSGKVSTGGAAGTEPEADFRPPSVTDVMIYVKQKKYHVDPERFVLFYSKNGWMEAGRKMTDWKKAVDLWQQRRW